MPVNSNTLIHFTSSLDVLKIILEGDFYPRLCLENYDYVLDKSEQHRYALPMTCFCDIPLHLVKDHMDEYGNYGIGLEKNWGIKRGLNPIQYVHKRSYLRNSIKDLYAGIVEANKISPNLELVRKKWNLLAYTKPYSGISHKTKERKIFYDEREWRYFPNFFSQDCDTEIPVLTEDEFNLEAKRESTHTRLKKYALEYTPSDIKYIIVNDESEILDIAKHITNIKSHKYTMDDLEILKTKIIAASYMHEDF